MALAQVYDNNCMDDLSSGYRLYAPVHRKVRVRSAHCHMHGGALMGTFMMKLDSAATTFIKGMELH